MTIGRTSTPRVTVAGEQVAAVDPFPSTASTKATKTVVPQQAVHDGRDARQRLRMLTVMNRRSQPRCPAAYSSR